MSGTNILWWALAVLGAAVLLPTGGSIIPLRWDRLNELHPQARTRFFKLFEAIEAAGYEVVLTSGYRPGSIDGHYFGLAVDFNLIHIATGKWYRAADKFDKATWEATGIPALIRAHGFRWGGDFTTPWVFQGVTHPGYDPIHADLLSLYPMATLRTKLAALLGTASVAQFDGRNVPLA